MASLVAVCRSDDYPFERRQIPLVVDNLTMVIQFNDSCIGCDLGHGVKQKELDRFVEKFRALSSDEIAIAMMVTSKEIFNMLAHMVPCVGCRRSVERLFGELVKSGHPALEPLVITPSNYLSIKRDYLFDPKAIYALFYLHGTKIQSVMGSIPKSKKNKRCILHSLDTHKTKTLGSWMDIWDVLSQECREEVILVECDSLMETLDSYLRKHRFCAECKSKVLRAYSLLVGEVDKNNEKGYCPALYDGLKCCTGEKHIHVLCETDFIAHLIGRAEPELVGSSRRERHAKTLDIAQEEVLTCLGIYLYERMHKIWQKLRAEEQTWQILFYLGVDSLRKSFEMALERKQGISNLELTCIELLEEEQAKEQKRVQKRQKKKKKKNTKATSSSKTEDVEEELTCSHAGKENYQCDENTNIPTVQCASCDEHLAKVASSGSTCHCPCPTKCTCSAKGKWHGGVKTGHWEGVPGNHNDCGYSSGHDCESCSIPSSHNGSDVACSEGICNHDGDSLLCQRVELEDVCRDCSCSPTLSPTQRASPKNMKRCSWSRAETKSDYYHTAVSSKVPSALSLADMLDQPCFSGQDEDRISEEEIRAFKANKTVLATKRQELREKLKQRFANMMQHNPSTDCDKVAGDIKKMSVN